MNLYDWCESERARLGKGHPKLVELHAAGWYARDVAAESRLSLKRGVVGVRPREIVAVEIRSLATDRVPKGGRHAFRKPVGMAAAEKRAERLLAGRKRASYYVHLIEDL